MVEEIDFSIHTNPVDVASRWVVDAENAGEVYPDAACLSTVRPDGYPDGRMVLVRQINDSGFVFFTNSNSVKGKSLAACSKASLTFHWKSLNRQLRVTGDVSMVSSDDADAYFRGRFLISQVGAWASAQSEVLDSRETLLERVDEVLAVYGGKEIPRPPHWNGYCIVPNRIEFWVEGEFRLHDRYEFAKRSDGWVLNRLNP